MKTVSQNGTLTYILCDKLINKKTHLIKDRTNYISFNKNNLPI